MNGVPIGETYGSPFTNLTDVGSLVSTLLSNAIVVAGVLLLFLLVGGGLAMIMGAGSNNPEQAAAGKKAATAALIGFLIIFGTYWIIQIVQILTGFEITGVAIR